MNAARNQLAPSLAFRGNLENLFPHGFGELALLEPQAHETVRRVGNGSQVLDGDSLLVTHIHDCFHA